MTLLAQVTPVSASAQQFRVQTQLLQQPASQGVGGRPELQSTKIRPKIATSKKVEKGGAPQHLLGSILAYFSSKKHPKNNAKNGAEKHVKKP